MIQVSDNVVIILTFAFASASALAFSMPEKIKDYIFALRSQTNSTRRSGRAVDCTGLENRQGVKAFGGSNPSSSAKVNECHLFGGIFILWRDRQAFSGLKGIDIK